MCKRTFSTIIALLGGAPVLGCGGDSPTAIETTEASGPVRATTGAPLTAGVFRVTFDTRLCGIDVTVSIFDAGADFAPDLPGGPPSKEAGVLKMTLTAANGKTVQFSGTGVVTRTSGPVSEDGTFVAVLFSAGLVGFSTPGGPPLTRDAGRIIIELLVREEEDGSFTVLSLEVLELSGPNVRVLSLEPVPGSFFCEVVTEVLG